jgi:hypothetical protein
VLGTAGALAWTVTRHVITQQNENLLQITPLALVLAVLLPASLRPGSRGAAARAGRLLAVALAALATVGLLLKALPTFYQRNAELIALFLPVHLALAWALWRVGRAQPIEDTPIASVDAPVVGPLAGSHGGRV